MMLVRELIQWLEGQDQEATVQVLVVERGRGWDGDRVSREDFDPEKHGDYTDMRGNVFAVGKPWENSRTLFLGDDGN